MCRQQFISLLVLSLVSCAVLARPSHAEWQVNGAPASEGNQATSTIVSDDAGGAIVTWQDYRTGTNWDIYAQRLDAAGAPQWFTNGVATPVAVCTAPNDQSYPTIVSDGDGGRHRHLE